MGDVSIYPYSGADVYDFVLGVVVLRSFFVKKLTALLLNNL
jgi:hypothetical protein